MKKYNLINRIKWTIIGLMGLLILGLAGCIENKPENPPPPPPPPSIVISKAWEVKTENGISPINICSESTYVVYSASGDLFVSGTKLYSDATLSNSLVISGSEVAFICDVQTGKIYKYENAASEIGADTGQSCAITKVEQ